MNYTKAAIEKARALADAYEAEILAEAMSFAALDLERKEIDVEHIERAYRKIWDKD